MKMTREENRRWLASRHDQHMEEVAVYWLHCVSRWSRHSTILFTI